MNEELKPCPFCGRADKMVIWATEETSFDECRLINWRVSCNAEGDETGCGGSSGVKRTREEAIAAWNRRVNE